jgi:hypothetical protein
MLSAAANRPGYARSETLRYLSDLNRSQEPRLKYAAGFAAQILNQALFFEHFPESSRESVEFMRYLLQRARAENPDRVLVLSSIPSAALIERIPREIRPLWHDTLARIGLTERQVALREDGLVDELEAASLAAGWLFVDLRECLRGVRSTDELYSSADLHISAVASRHIGRCQADALTASHVLTE